MDDSFRTLIRDFVDEARPLAERLCDAFLEIERRWAAEEPAGDLLPQIKSDLHTLKGNSGLMGLTPLQTLAHRVEDLCGLLEERRSLRNGDVADLLIEAGDHLKQMVIASLDDAIDQAAVVPVVKRLERAIEGRFRGEKPDGAGLRATSDAAEASDATVRIHFRKLDALLELVGEAMVARSMVETAQRRPEAGRAERERAMQLLDAALRNLQERLVESRLLPVSSIFRRFTRPARDTARQEGKRVSLRTVGADTTIDKGIIDRLGDPLLHLVRNAIAHGIERPDEREAAGKPAEGIVLLHAEQLSDRVLISVSDDGRGIDAEKVAAHARALGHEADELTQDQLHALIFQPGFSTAEHVSTLSGRGVGLDVVAAAIERLGGSVSLQSETGRGTTFTLDLPLTLAVVRALFIDIDEEIYAVPLSYVLESFRFDPAAVHVVDGRPWISWREEMVALVDGRELLGTPERRAMPYCVVLAAGNRRCGLLVSALRGRHDVVVKSVEEALGSHPIVSGVTTLGDGRIVLILDAASITGGRSGGVRPPRQRRDPGLAPAAGRG